MSTTTASAVGASLIARLERLPVTRPVLWARGCVGMATFFDGYTTIALAYALPILAREWGLTPATTAAIISSGYLGQLVGAIFFGWLAERIGRLPVLAICIGIFAVMSAGCIFAWSAQSLILFRFLQGIGTGGEVPVASAYVNELSGAKKRGRFFLLYELLFLVGLTAAGAIGYTLVPKLGWQSMFIVGMVPVALVIPLRFFLSESPRWLIARGRFAEADQVVERLEDSARQHNQPLPDPAPISAVLVEAKPAGSIREMFSPLYGPRTLLLWAMWFGAYMINNGLLTWLPTLYRTVFDLPINQAIGYGFAMTGVALVASFICALTIDKVGRRRWYTGALLFAAVPLTALYLLGASNPIMVFALATPAFAALQTVTYSLYLYSGELYPTRLRSLGAGLGSAWLRAGSIAGPWVIGLIMSGGSVAPVFLTFAVVAALTGLVVLKWAPETSGKALEELSP
ncbi:MFS transporter [Novosphingobium sp. P6W]|uniref:MFS transporter n=1 Tax=Novosphingobium sp. P6W TaxID=1609758 RepID=UPI0005C314A8|nr:MFS transporter [Novosphingobium sp. P6W]AXB75925.1 MFS transporter [Novosphingobium sp. P6W]KIS29935.1 membrane protein [Novosphingobium sp. P6W]